MVIWIKGLRFRLDFSFILVISFALLYGHEKCLLLILYSVLHEIGHLFWLLIFKADVNEICLSFFGFGIKFGGMLSLKHEAIMLAGGPLVNLALFAVFGDDINLLLLIMNVLPVYPLDGGRLINIFLPNYSKYISAVFLIAILSVSVWLLIEYKIFSLLLISVYLLIFNLRLL